MDVRYTVAIPALESVALGDGCGVVVDGSALVREDSVMVVVMVAVLKGVVWLLESVVKAREWTVVV